MAGRERRGADDVDVLFERRLRRPPPASGTSRRPSTSKPRSAKAVAITFWPRSWPSWPILATRMRGLRAVVLSNASTLSCTRATARIVAERLAVDAGDGVDLRRHGGRTPFPAPARSRRRWHWRGPRGSRIPADCRRPSRPSGQRRERGLDGGDVARALERLQLGELARPHRGIVDLQHVDLVVGRGPVRVDADQRLLRRNRCAPGCAPRLPRCAASACRARSPRPCRRAPRPPRYGSARVPPGRASAVRR